MLSNKFTKIIGFNMPCIASFAVKQFVIKGVGKPDGNSTLTIGSGKTFEITSPLEMVLTALAGCENAVCRQYAREKRLTIKNMNFTKVAAKFNTDGFLGKPVEKNIFDEAEIEVEVETNMKESDFEKMHHEMMKRCPVFQILEKSGTKMKQKFVQKKY